MPKKSSKKPLLILKFSNNRNKCKHESKSHPKKTKKSGSSGSPTSVRGNSGPKKLKS